MKEKKMKKDKKEKRQKEDKKEDADEESMMKTESEDKHKKGNKPNNESNLGLNKDSVKISKDAKKNSVAEVWASEQQEHHKSQKKFLDSRSVGAVHLLPSLISSVGGWTLDRHHATAA